MCEKFFTSTKWWLNNVLRGIPLIGALWLPLKAAHAQILQSNRYEVQLGENEVPYEITAANSNGLFLNRHFIGYPTDQLEIIRIDTAFVRLWSGYIPIEKSYIIAGKKAYNHRIFFLFRSTDPTKKNLILFSIDSSGNYLQYTIKSFIRFSITELQVINNALLIGGYFNQVPLVLYFNLSLGESKILPGIFNEEGELTQIKPYADGTFDVLISAKNILRQNTIWIKKYTNDGNLIENDPLKPDENKNLIFGRSIVTARHNELVAGVYGNRNSVYSRGLFVASVDPSGNQEMKYYNFGDLENFFKYMKVKRESRIKERIQRRKIKGKAIRFNYRFLVHEIIEQNGQYIMLGEAFYPKYKTVSNPGLNSFGMRGAYNYGQTSVFDGYWYTHAVIIAFDNQGKLLWDNSFEINDVKSFTLEQFVKLEVRKDKIVLLYLFENNLRTKIIHDNEVLESKIVSPIKTNYAGDTPLKGSSISKLDYWYGTYMYAYGIQNILNVKDPNIPSTRKVFFINKISYQ